ncbi:MAG: ABC transporter ATP-binding protein [Angelakisella sp.]
MSQNVNINDVVKTYGDFNAVNHVSAQIKEGELFTLLGPSGCGKTTLLRMIAGFNSIESGTIALGDTVINDIPAHKRNMGMVFQNYAIFPHMTVFDNVAYGLKARKIPKAEIKSRVTEALKMVQIEALSDRQPANMSGGQQQRVALARVIVIQPDILLMDEPLSNLDAKLRVQMRTTIKKVQHKLGITTIYVTHDQEEALAISDRIAIMSGGVIQQIGKPKEIYTRPANEFVANFIGTSAFLNGTILENNNGKARIALLDDLCIEVPLKCTATGAVKVSVRPEEFVIREKGTRGMAGRIGLKTFLGDFINYEIELSDGSTVEANQYAREEDAEYDIGCEISLDIMQHKVNIFDESGKEALLDE